MKFAVSKKVKIAAPKKTTSREKREGRMTNGSGSSESEIEGDDRLSDLPQDILHHIFSKFEIEEVARTSILSKKWRYFWTSHPHLSFTSDYFSTTDDFEKFVSHVLTLHKSSKITFFSVLSFGSCSKSRIRSWVRFAVQRGVEKLYLQSSKPDFDSLVLPHALFTSKTLTVLELGLNISSKGYRVELPLPSSIDLPCLRKLGLLAMARFNTQFLHRMFSGCPVLETLDVSYCVFDESRSLLISSAQLKNLIVRNCIAEDDTHLSKITVSAPGLISFSCSFSDYDFSAYHLENLSSLESVDHEITGSFVANANEAVANCMINFLQGIYNVKFLTLSACSVQEISRAVDIYKGPSLRFANLRQLKVTIRMTEKYLQALMYMLQTSPGVETLVMNRIGGKTKLTKSELAKVAGQIPLQNVKSIQVQACTEDLEFLKILLKNATNLEKMTVVSAKDSSDQLEVFTNKLRNCPRASTIAEILVS